MLLIADFGLGRSSLFVNVRFGLSGAEAGEKAAAAAKWQSSALEGSRRRELGQAGS